MHSVNITSSSYSVSRIVQPDYCVMQVSVLTQAHCVSNTLLPVHSRIQYKLCMLMHDVYHGKQISGRCGDRLRSSSRGDFIVQRTRLRLAEKLFSVAGPRARNSLPSHIRTLVSSDSFSRHFFQALLWHSVICSYSRCCVNCVCF